MSSSHEQLPELKREFFHSPAEKFTPFYGVADATAAQGSRIQPSAVAPRHRRDR
jgi:hypothetical protein